MVGRRTQPVAIDQKFGNDLDKTAQAVGLKKNFLEKMLDDVYKKHTHRTRSLFTSL